MTFKNSLLLVGMTTFALAACTIGPPDAGDQYWQRISTSEAVYQQGPKAQQMLDRDIGRCVVELKELTSLGAIKNPIPADHKGRVLGPDETAKMIAWDPSKHDASLTPTDSNFSDFNGCMKSKGWERIYAAGTSAIHTHYSPVPEFGSTADDPLARESR